MALLGDWSDVDCSKVRTSLTWWHAPADAEAPLPGARRLPTHIPQPSFTCSVTTRGTWRRSTARATSSDNGIDLGVRQFEGDGAGVEDE